MACLKSGFYDTKQSSLPRLARAGIALIALWLLAAPVSAGDFQHASYGFQARGSGSCGVTPVAASYSPQLAYGGGVYYAGVGYDGGDGIAPNMYYRSGRGPYGSVYGYNSGYYSQFDFENERLHEERRRDAIRQRREDRQERLDQERERAFRRQHAFQPKPAEDYEVRVHGYNQRSYDQVVDAALARNQSEARAAYRRSKTVETFPGKTMIGVGDEQYYYGNGNFYALGGDGDLVKVQAPVGAMVFSLPENAETEEIGGVTYYEYSGAYYTRVQVMGRLVYKVVPDPHG